jgi:hypothetical protein
MDDWESFHYSTSLWNRFTLSGGSSEFVVFAVISPELVSLLVNDSFSALMFLAACSLASARFSLGPIPYLPDRLKDPNHSNDALIASRRIAWFAGLSFVTLADNREGKGGEIVGINRTQ